MQSKRKYTLHTKVHIAYKSTHCIQKYTLHTKVHFAYKSTHCIQKYTLHTKVHITYKSTHYIQKYTLHYITTVEQIMKTQINTLSSRTLQSSNKSAKLTQGTSVGKNNIFESSIFQLIKFLSCSSQHNMMVPL